MNAEVKEKWVAALRSGEYKQGRLGLRGTDGKFCCLGVLCDLYAKETGAEWGEPSCIVEHGRRVIPFGESKETDYPPSEVRIWAGLNSGNPSVRTPETGGGKIPIAVLNDGDTQFMRQPFAVIADLIEVQL